jgi:hypothetical protein
MHTVFSTKKFAMTGEVRLAGGRQLPLTKARVSCRFSPRTRLCKIGIPGRASTRHSWPLSQPGWSHKSGLCLRRRPDNSATVSTAMDGVLFTACKCMAGGGQREAGSESRMRPSTVNRFAELSWGLLRAPNFDGYSTKPPFFHLSLVLALFTLLYLGNYFISALATHRRRSSLYTQENPKA